MATAKKKATGKKSSSRRSAAATPSEPTKVKTLKDPLADPPEEEESQEERAGEVAEKAAPAPAAPKLDSYWVELLEGSSYTLMGRTFVRKRPVVVTDPAILSAVLRNGRFSCRRAGGG